MSSSLDTDKANPRARRCLVVALACVSAMDFMRFVQNAIGNHYTIVDMIGCSDSSKETLAPLRTLEAGDPQEPHGAML